MGEAMYYMKAKWPSEELAKEALPKVRALLERMADAEEAWQAERPPVQAKAAADASLWARYGDLFEALSISMLEPGADLRALDYLAGHLCSPASDPDWKIEQNGSYIMFHGTVWHFANWDGIGKTLKKLGAIAWDWLSDESITVDHYSLLEV